MSIQPKTILGGGKVQISAADAEIHFTYCAKPVTEELALSLCPLFIRGRRHQSSYVFTCQKLRSLRIPCKA